MFKTGDFVFSNKHQIMALLVNDVFNGNATILEYHIDSDYNVVEMEVKNISEAQLNDKFKKSFKEIAITLEFRKNYQMEYSSFNDEASELVSDIAIIDKNGSIILNRQSEKMVEIEVSEKELNGDNGYIYDSILGKDSEFRIKEGFICPLTVYTKLVKLLLTRNQPGAIINLNAMFI